MVKKLCQDCKKNPVAYITREDKNSPTRFICKECAPKYAKQGITSYNILNT